MEYFAPIDETFGERNQFDTGSLPINMDEREITECNNGGAIKTRRRLSSDEIKDSSLTLFFNTFNLK